VGKWITPNSSEEGTACYQITLPVAVDWLSAFMGALYELSLSGNWEQSGDQTPDQMAEFWGDLFDLFCNPPDGPVPC